MGDTGQNTGRTYSGDSGWRQIGRSTLALSVDTRSAGFGVSYKSVSNISVPEHTQLRPPSYFVSLSGVSRQWESHGAHIIHNPTINGFEVVLQYTRGRHQGMKWLDKAEVKAGQSGSKKFATLGQYQSLAEMAEAYLWSISWIGEKSCCHLTNLTNLR